MKEQILGFLNKQKKGLRKLRNISDNSGDKITFVYNKTSYIVERYVGEDDVEIRCAPYAYNDLMIDDEVWNNFEEFITVEEFEDFYKNVVEGDEFNFIGKLWMTLEKIEEDDCFESRDLLKLFKAACDWKTDSIRYK